MRKKNTKTKSNYYFDASVDEAILKYNVLENSVEKEKLYREKLYPALDKLSENVINVFKAPYIDLEYEDLKHELVVYLTERLHKFSPNLGKGFSYYTLIGRNYIIAQNKKGYEKEKQKVSVEHIDFERDVVHEVFIEEYRDSLEQFMEEWIIEIDSNLKTMFPKEDDRKAADSILELFRSRKFLDFYNKKLLYVLIRERADTKTQTITKVIKILQAHFYRNFEEYRK